MNVWNKVLFGLIATLCVAFSVLVVFRYSVAQKNEAELAKQIKEIESARQEVAELKKELYGTTTGSEADWESLSLNSKLDCVRSLNRGETFSNCAPVDVATNGGYATISFVVDDSCYGASSFQHGTVAYVFDSGVKFVEKKKDSESSENPDEDVDVALETMKNAPIQTTFLGEFKVDAVSGTQASLVSTEMLTEEEANAALASKNDGRSWIVCLNALPFDSPVDLSVDSPDVLAPISKTFAAYAEEVAKNALTAEAADWTDAQFLAADVLSAADFAKELETKTAADANAALVADAERATSNETTEKTASDVYPIDFQRSLAFQRARRNVEKDRKTRLEIINERFGEIFFDQLVSINGNVDEAKVAQAAPEVQKLYERDDAYQKRYQEAVGRKPATMTFDEEEAALQIARDKMVDQQNLVQTKLNEAKAAVEECRKAIESTIAKNAELASKLANAQILVAEKIEREAASRTASVEPNFSFNRGI